MQSFHYCKYRRDENQLYIFADDVYPRWLTASHHVDFDTMAGADKFGNVYFVRLPQDVSDEIEEDPPLCGRDHMAYRSAYFPVKVCLLPPEFLLFVRLRFLN